MVFLMPNKRHPMHRLMVLFLIACLFSGGWAGNARGEEKVRVYFFWSIGCPHCKDEMAFLEILKRKYPMLDITSLEVSRNQENGLLFSRMAEAHGVKLLAVPATFIGDQPPLIGYTDDKTTGRQIEERIRNCIEQACPDPRAKMEAPFGSILTQQEDFTKALLGEQEGVCPKEEECPDEEKVKPPVARQQRADRETPVPPQAPVIVPEKEEQKKETVTVPILGEIDPLRTSLPYQTIIIAGLDGFNPCAFFVLFTLLGLLIHVQSRKKVLLIGGIFVFFSGFIYFIFMAAWLNFFLLSGEIAAITVVAGIVALAIALINIKDFFYFKKGVSLSIPDSAKPKLFDRMRKLMKASSFSSIILGTVVLAVAANTYELFCTAGFPMVYTRILTLNNLPKASYYLYLVFYNLIYVIPLGTIVLIFAITLGAKKLTEWQGQVLKLVSGMMMLGLGSVLILRPDLLNNLLVTAGILAGSIAVSAVIIVLTKRLKGTPA